MKPIRMTPTRRLLLWVYEQSRPLHRNEYHRRGIHLRSHPPAQNGLFGGRVPSMVRVGNYRFITSAGEERARRYRTHGV